MTTFLSLSAFGLLVGLVLARLAARGRRIRLSMELKQAEAEVERLGYIETALTAYPFGESIPMVSTALTSARILRYSARRRADLCRAALKPRRWLPVSDWTPGVLLAIGAELLVVVLAVLAIVYGLPYLIAPGMAP